MSITWSILLLGIAFYNVLIVSLRLCVCVCVCVFVSLIGSEKILQKSEQLLIHCFVQANIINLESIDAVSIQIDARTECHVVCLSTIQVCCGKILRFIFVCMCVFLILLNSLSQNWRNDFHAKIHWIFIQLSISFLYFGCKSSEYTLIYVPYRNRTSIMQNAREHNTKTSPKLNQSVQWQRDRARQFT